VSEGERELGDAGDAPAPDAAHSKAGDPALQPRPFRGWASAHEETTSSVWTKVAALFRREAPRVSGEPFSSVDDALPAPDPTASDMPFLVLDEVASEPQKPGLISRMFRRSKSTPRPSLEVEIHEDRIAAAADALDQVGEQSFADSQERPRTSADAFGSVEEALPDDNGRFAPRAFRGADDANRDLENTFEMVPDFEHLGSTQEIDRVRPSADRESDDSSSYFGDTLDPAVFGPSDTSDIDGDTDEFAIPLEPEPAFAAPPPLPGLDEDTAKISRKSLIESLMFWRAKTVAEAGPGSTILEAPPAFLFSKFRNFYNEIIRFKHQKTEFTAGFSTAIVTEYAADLSPDGAAEALSKKLVAMLELQAAEAMWMGGESAERYPDAQYAMVALADEIFLNTEWEGQGAWSKNLLEAKLFRTHCAEVELFRRVDKLLKDQPDSSASRDLARVYMFVIAAGFAGKYRTFGLTRALAEYRQRLFEYIHQGGDALMIYAPERRIFPEAAQRTLVGEAVSRFTAAQRWAAILAFLVVGYTAIAHFAWSRVSADLKDVTDRIEAGSVANRDP
jgi:type IV/VI secretion system ImpK/VasF family protein